jgi:O-antigen/teichoic acid export membrane protein
MEIKQKGIVKNGFFTILQVLVTTLTWILAYYLIIHLGGRTAGKEQIGLWSTISGVPATLMVFGSGVSGCLVRYIPVYVAGQDYVSVKQIIVSGFLFNLVLAGAICIAGWLFADPLLRYYFHLTIVPSLYRKIYLVSLFTFFFNFTGSVFLSGLDGLQMIYRRNFIMMAASVVFGVLAVSLIRWMGIMGLVYAQVIQSLIMLTLALLALQKTRVFNVDSPLLNWSQVKLFLTYGQGLQLIMLSIVFYDPVIRYFINRYYTLKVVGMYDIVNRAITQVTRLIVSAIQVIVPVVSRQQQEKTLDIGDLTRKSMRGGGLLSALGFCWILILAVPLVIYTGEQKNFDYYFVFLFMLSAGYLMNTVTSGPYSIMMGLGHLKPVVISHVLSALLNYALFLVLGQKPSAFLLILPPASAVFFSSAYLLWIYLKRHSISLRLPPAEDIWLYGISLAGVLLSWQIYLFTGSLPLLLLLDAALALLSLYFLYRNSFLLSIFEKLFLKFN